eukprot:280123_1
MSTSTSTNTAINYKHHAVELKCNSTDSSITIPLPSSFDNQPLINIVTNAIRNEFKLFSNLKDSDWLLTINDTIINKHDVVQFDELLTSKIPPPAIVYAWIKPSIVHEWIIKNRTHSNSLINEIIDDMTVQELRSLKQLISNCSSHHDFKMSWNHLTACIKHEMWPKLASVVKAMVANDDEKQNDVIDIYDLSDECVSKVMNILKKKRHLPREECGYLKGLIHRAKNFEPYQYHPNEEGNNVSTNDSNDHNEVLCKALCMDIFDVHKIFLFANFNFGEYTVDQFKTDIKDALGQTFVETYSKRLSFEPRFNLYPMWIIDDDMFRVFEYPFGVSCFINDLKHNLYIEQTEHFEVQCVVIPQAVSCVYDEHTPFNYNIGAMEHYLYDKQITDFYKIRLKSNRMKDPPHIAKKIEANYNFEDVTANHTSKLMIIIDRRNSKRTQYDSMYIFPYQTNERFSELKSNYFICFHSKIVRNIGVAGNKVVTHFSFGLNGMTRFFPQMLVSIMPRFFRKPQQLSEAEYLHKIYENAFKNGWCVVLEDRTFNKYYKMMTTFTLVTVNYNRHILYDEFQTIPMLCFMDLLHHEMETNNAFSVNDIIELDSFFNDNEYSTESIVNDVWVRPDDSQGSNIEILMRSNRQFTQFSIIQSIVRKYNEPAPQHKAKICSFDHVFDANQCSFIQTIIDGLKLFHEEKMSKVITNVSSVLGAYDHMVSVHGFWVSHHGGAINETAEVLEETKSQSFEAIDHTENISNAQRYIIDELGGYCTSQPCTILQRHIMRRRERYVDEADGDPPDDNERGLGEILYATLSALHCYIAHEKKELFRLKRENGNSHFITPIIDETEVNVYVDERTASKAMPNLNFGVSVLKWLDHSEEPMFDDFHDEMIHNPEST